MDFIIFSLNKWSKIVFFLEKHDYYLVFRPFFIPLSVARSVLSLENLNKSRFIWYFPRLFVPLHTVMQIMMHWDISHL